VSKFSVISADSHVVEPGDLWARYIEPKYRERAPHLERQGDADQFVADGANIVPPAGFSVAGRPMGAPRTFAEGVYPGAYEPEARLKDMARDGVEADVLYPSVALRMFPIADFEFKWACFRAYNRWAGDFCKARPDRFKAVALIAFEDVELAVNELQACHTLGLKGAMLTVASDDPNLYRGQSLDPFWAAAQDLDMPISLHVITNQQKNLDLRTEVASSLYHHSIERSLSSLTFGGVFMRFPGLKVVSAENDAGWAPYLMERMDFLYGDPRRHAYQDYPIKNKGVLPSEYMRRNVWYTFMRDHSAVYVRDLVGPSHLMWASDYPHNDSTWPNSQEVLGRLFHGVSTAHRRTMTADAAAELYGFE